MKIYQYMRGEGFSRLSIKILLGYHPDGIDRLTVLLGKATDYDYKLLRDKDFRSREVARFLREAYV